MRFFLANKMSFFAQIKYLLNSNRSVEMKSERLTRVEGFGTLNRRVYMTSMWDTTYTIADTVFILSRMCRRMWKYHSYLLSILFALAVYTRMYIPWLRRQLSRRQSSANGGALCGLSPPSSNLRNHFVNTDPLLACGDLHGPHIR